MNTQSTPATSVVSTLIGLVLLGIGLYTGMHGATAIGLILAVFFGIRWLRPRRTQA